MEKAESGLLISAVCKAEVSVQDPFNVHRNLAKDTGRCLSSSGGAMGSVHEFLLAAVGMLCAHRTHSTEGSFQLYNHKHLALLDKC